MKRKNLLLVISIMVSNLSNAQDTIISQTDTLLPTQENSTGVSPDENTLKISGELTTDDRFLFKDRHDWAWNENRLSLKIDKKITNISKFYSDVWLRNMGLPAANKSSDLYNKGIVDPYSMDIREAYVQISGFLSKKLDLKIGRQRITWGTADKLNPTDNLNPYDLEDILDFGRHRGSDAINLNYYFNSDFSFQAVYIPLFQPANMPVGIFSNALTPTMNLPLGMILKGTSDTLLLPRYNLSESSTAGIKIKGIIKEVDFSLSYVWGYDGLPFSSKNTLTPVDTTGGININSQLSFLRTHIIGADMATSIAGIGFWAEAAAFIPDMDAIMTSDLSALYPTSPVSVTIDTTILKKTEPYIKFVLGGDYNFSDGSYVNCQYLHGFINERGNKNLNDYFFLRYEKKFFNEKLKLAPVSGAFIVTDWNHIEDNYAIAYMPQITYNATDDVEISLSATFIDGKGNNLFSNLKDYSMFGFKMKYSF